MAGLVNPGACHNRCYTSATTVQGVKRQANELKRAVEVFARSYAHTRSMTYPCCADRVGATWVIRDEKRKRDEYRSEEWVAIGTAATEVHRAASEGTRGRYAVCAICAGDQAETRAAYKALGYRLRTTEPLMVHRLNEIPTWESSAQVTRVKDPELAERLNKQTKSRMILKEQLGSDANLRQYVAIVDGAIVGWVRSVATGKSTWCSNLYVEPPQRRKGIARSMLCRMLHDDKQHGSTLAVLLASHTGALLYPVVGYEQIGTLLLYSPPKTVRR